MQTWSPEIERMWTVPPSRNECWIAGAIPDRSPRSIPRASAATGRLKDAAKARARRSRIMAPASAPRSGGSAGASMESGSIVIEPESPSRSSERPGALVPELRASSGGR
jgi:hypothetical protein